MADIAYRVIQRADGSFRVEMVEPGSLPRFAAGFPTEADANAWIVEDKRLGGLDPRTAQSVRWNGRL